jgi:Virulence factor BrkB
MRPRPRPLELSTGLTLIVSAAARAGIVFPSAINDTRSRRARSRCREVACAILPRFAKPIRGRVRASPGWKDIFWRTYRRVNDDQVTLIAAGATYYALLALVPALTALVSIYGLFADSASVARHIGSLSSVVPQGGMQIINDQLTRLTQHGGTALRFALIISLMLALWSVGSAVKAMFEAMNIAYGERESASLATWRYFQILVFIRDADRLWPKAECPLRSAIMHFRTFRGYRGPVCKRHLPERHLVSSLSIQLPWKPGGTRCGKRTLATGASANFRASRMTRSVVSVPMSITKPISQP